MLKTVLFFFVWNICYLFWFDTENVPLNITKWGRTVILLCIFYYSNFYCPTEINFHSVLKTKLHISPNVIWKIQIFLMEVWYFICTKVCVNFYPMGSGASCASQVSYCAPLAPKYTHIHSSTSTFFWLANQRKVPVFKDLSWCPHF